jgi:STE24 endopeptidase
MTNEDKATRYHRLRRRATMAGAGASALVLVGLIVSGGSGALRDLIEQTAGPSLVWSVTLYTVALTLFSEAVQLPFAYYHGVTLERRYGLSTQSAAHWWLDRAKATVVGLVLLVGAALIVYALLQWWPERWWLAASAVFGVVLVGLAHVAPIVLLPIFYEFTPIDRPALVTRLTSLAARANAPVLGVFQWRLSDRTRKANAALAGTGRTRRILLSDTLLAEHSDDEIEVILAHELAHHVHRDIWSSLVLDGLLVTVGLFAADYVLTNAGPWLGLQGNSDLAGLPLLALAVGAVSLLLLPIANAVSRAHERRADRYALETTRNGGAFVSAMRKLSVSNLAEDRPSRLVEVLLHSHPPTSARIAAAQRWMAKQQKGGSSADTTVGAGP